MDAARIRALEVDLLASWPSQESETIGGWHVGAAAGVTGRANSVTVLDPDAAGLATRIDRAERWYQDRGLVPRFRLTPISEPDLAPRLEDRGYRDRNGQTDTLECELPDRGDHDEHDGIDISTEAGPEWWTLSDRSPTEQRVIDDMLAPLGSAVGRASRRSGRGLAAIGMGIVVDQRASIATVHTHPDHRGRGHAVLVMRALHRWARSRGARSTFLNVLHHNDPAQGLYDKLGYRFVYPYRYLEHTDA